MAACLTAATIKFTVRRRPAVLVAPAAPTPHELKQLSDFDIQDFLRLHVSAIHFYRRTESMGGKDPVVVIRDAIASALVPYYPFAGRLREHDGGRFAVDCTAEGVLFVEDDADIRLEQFGDALLPPFPCVEELIFDVPGSSAILNAPLLLFQVTRLACGGFVFGVRLNHTMADGVGMTQFLGAVAELARGDAQGPTPTVPPVWERHLLQGRRDAPQRSDELDLCNEHDDSSSSILLALSSSLDEVDDMALRFFFFGPEEIAAIRAQLPPPLDKRASRFDTIAGWLWKCRTMALAPADSNEVMLMSIVVNARGRTAAGSAGIPAGYYGNAFAEPIAVSTARELCANAVGYAVGLVKAAKDKVDMEYMRSAADLIVQRRWRVPRGPASLYSLTDHTKIGLHDLDFGWGRPLYGGMAEAIENPDLPWQSSLVLPFKKNADGEDGASVPVCLPRQAMDRLVDEMGKLRRRCSPADAATLPYPRHGVPAVVGRSAF